MEFPWRRTLPAGRRSWPTGPTVTARTEMDVFTDGRVPARLHQQLRVQLDAIASKGGTHPMPQYHNLIDPSLNAVDGLWVPAEFEATGGTSYTATSSSPSSKRALAATGQRLPFGFGLLANRGGGHPRRGRLRDALADPDLDPRAWLNVATQKLMGCALPLLARLRRPALLLPAAGRPGAAHRAR